MLMYEDRILQIKKIIKYVLLVLIILIPLILFFNSCSAGYKDVEEELITAAKDYVKENNVVINKETYIELGFFENIKGTELCSNASGVIVRNENGKLTYEPYLVCSDYVSTLVDNKNKYLILNGDEVTILNKGEVFNDPLYTLLKEADVLISGNVGTNPGIYTITYSAYVGEKLKETLIRKVIRVENDKNSSASGLSDKQNPVLTLLGAKNIVLNIGETYKEPGYLAVDYEDGKITRQVEVSGSVNTKAVGTYTMTYTITNSKGLSAIAARTITVVRQKADLNIETKIIPETITDKAEVTVNVTGSGYRYAVLPDGQSRSSTSFSYLVSHNGVYKFKVYDQYDNELEQVVEVTNVDDKAPKIESCKAIVGGGTAVTIVASDENGIGGYNYILDDTASGFVTYDSFNDRSSAKKVQVEVKDIVGNIAKASCEIEEQLVISNPSNLIACNGDRTTYNNEIKRIVAQNGQRTRKTATALAMYISNQIDVKIPYFWAGGHWHYSWDGEDDPEMFRGFSPTWGCELRNMKDGRMLPAGFDCTGFIAWVLFNAGFTKDEIGSWSGASALSRIGDKKLPVIDFAGSTGRIQAGDIVWRTGHMGFVIDVDGSTVTIAHAKGTAWGLIVEKYSSDTGRQIGGNSTFMKVSMMDNYYK